MPEVVGLRPSDPVRIAQYRVLGRLGAGGQGIVYLAETPAGERVAIKQLLAGGLDDARALRQLGKEVAAARRVAPFCTARVLDADLDAPSPYVVSEYIDGPSLQQQVREHGPLTGGTLHWTAIGTATALAAIHQAGVVHRDFKPANVMLAPDGPRVIDFGIARDLSADLTVTSMVMGTPAYMAPEQIRNEPVGPAADLFAWASVVAFAGTGRAPFDAGHMVAVANRIATGEPDLSGLPPELTAVLRRCLAKDPEQRPTAQQVLALLLGRPEPARDLPDPDPLLAEAAGAVHRAATPEPAVRPATRPTTHRLHPDAVPVPGRSRPPEALPAEKSFTGRTLAAAVAVVLVAAVVWGVGRLDDRRDRQQPSGTATTSSSSSPTSAAAATAPVVPPTTAPTVTTVVTAPATTTPAQAGSATSPPVVPEALDGDWEGTALQPLGSVSSWTVRIELDEGDTEGRIELPDLDCRGTVTVTGATANTLDMAATIDENRKGLCAPDVTVRLTSAGVDQAAFLWRDSTDARNVAAGTLTR